MGSKPGCLGGQLREHTEVGGIGQHTSGHADAPMRFYVLGHGGAHLQRIVHGVVEVRTAVDARALHVAHIVRKRGERQGGDGALRGAPRPPHAAAGDGERHAVANHGVQHGGCGCKRRHCGAGVLRVRRRGDEGRPGGEGCVVSVARLERHLRAPVPEAVLQCAEHDECVVHGDVKGGEDEDGVVEGGPRGRVSRAIAAQVCSAKQVMTGSVPGLLIFKQPELTAWSLISVVRPDQSARPRSTTKAYSASHAAEGTFGGDRSGRKASMKAIGSGTT